MIQFYFLTALYCFFFSNIKKIHRNFDIFCFHRQAAKITNKKTAPSAIKTINYKNMCLIIQLKNLFE
jgi:hypothetical protein